LIDAARQHRPKARRTRISAAERARLGVFRLGVKTATSERVGPAKSTVRALEARLLTNGLICNLEMLLFESFMILSLF